MYIVYILQIHTMTFIKGPAAVENPPVSAAEVEEAQPAQTDPAVSAPANMDEEVRM